MYVQYNLSNSNLRNSKTSLIRTKFHSPTAIFSLYLTPPNSNISVIRTISVVPWVFELERLYCIIIIIII